MDDESKSHTSAPVEEALSESEASLMSENERLKGYATELQARIQAHERTEAALRLQLAYVMQGWERYVSGTLT